MKSGIGFIPLCCLLTVAALYQTQVAHWNTSIGDGPLILAGMLLAAALFVKAFFLAIKKPVSTTGRQLFPLFLWLGSVSVVAIYDLWLNRVNHVPNFLHVSSGSDFGIDGFTLKKDSCYIYWNGSGFGEARNYGTYIQQDSIIILRPFLLRNAPRQTRLLIRPYSRFLTPAFTPNSRIYLLDSRGRITKFDTGYRIVELAASQ